MKLPETRTCSVTYHNKAMYQVSVDEYVRGFGKKSEKPPVGQTESKPTWSPPVKQVEE